MTAHNAPRHPLHTLPSPLRRMAVRLAAGLLAAACLGLLAPAAAFAQDDPGLAPSTSPPPDTTPPAATTTAPAATTTAPAATPTSAATAAPAAQSRTAATASTTAASAPGQPGAYQKRVLVSSTTHEESKIEDLKTTELTPDEWEARMVVPTLYGPTGLFRTLTAEVGLPLNLRVASHLQFFRGSGAILTTDTDSRFMGELAIDLTGPDIVILRNLEAYLTIFNASNENERPTVPGRTDPAVILSLADVGWGLKGAWDVAKGLSLGGNLGVRMFNSVSGDSADFGATNVNIDLLATYDVRKIAAKVPLRFHLNFGYYDDKSLNLLPTDAQGRQECYASTMNDGCIGSRLVQIFAYGLNTSRVRLALAVELPLRPKVKWGYFGVDPFFEYHMEAATSGGDPILATALAGYGDRTTNRITQYGTVGLRLRPVSRLAIDLGLDFAIQSPGYQFGPPLARWNFIVGAAYTYDSGGLKSKTVTRTITNTYEVDRRPPVGYLGGVVRDAKTHKPIGGAVLAYPVGGFTPQASAEDGSYKSYGLPPGPMTVHVTHPGYEPANVDAQVLVGATQPLDVMLTPVPPKPGKVRIRVVDKKQNPVMNGVVRLTGPVTRDALPDGELFGAEVPEGRYTLTIDAPGFLAVQRQLVIKPTREELVDITLEKRPTHSHVELTAKAIKINGTIHFASNEARILTDGQEILDEVADVLAKNPQIRKVSIEGHTDNRGGDAKNLTLSRQRARAVLDYLADHGIARDRMTSQGFGSSKPLVPNTSPANRAKNRRVEFRILDQGPAGSGGDNPMILPR